MFRIREKGCYIKINAYFVTHTHACNHYEINVIIDQCEKQITIIFYTKLLIIFKAISQ